MLPRIRRLARGVMVEDRLQDNDNPYGDCVAALPLFIRRGLEEGAKGAGLDMRIANCNPVFTPPLV